MFDYFIFGKSVMFDLTSKFLRDERGAATIDFVVLAAGVSVMAIAVYGVFDPSKPVFILCAKFPTNSATWADPSVPEFQYDFQVLGGTAIGRLAWRLKFLVSTRMGGMDFADIAASGVDFDFSQCN